MAEKADKLLHLGLSEEQRPRLAQGLHWTYGLGAASGYALIRRRAPLAAAGQGLLFGGLFALIGDELFTAVTGLAEPPQEYPWQAHARGFVGHLAFGVAAKMTLDLLDRVA
jgi:uncharacterized membrane protein YagU involved in acid resistance